MAFSPKGELIVSDSEDGIIVVDVRAGVLMPMTYSFSQGGDQTDVMAENFGISFDSSKIAATSGWDRHLCVWDLPIGTLFHTFKHNEYVRECKCSRPDQYIP